MSNEPKQPVIDDLLQVEGLLDASDKHDGSRADKDYIDARKLLAEAILRLARGEK